MTSRLPLPILLSIALLGGCASTRDTWDRVDDVADSIEDLGDIGDIDDLDDVDDIVDNDLWDFIEDHWPRYRHSAGDRWHRLSDDDLDDIDGDREDLIEDVADYYGIPERRAAAQVDAWARRRN